MKDHTNRARTAPKLDGPWGFESGDPATLSSSAYTHYFLAMTCHALNRVDETQKWLARANALADDELAVDSLVWSRKLTLQILRAEAVALLGVIQNE